MKLWKKALLTIGLVFSVISLAACANSNSSSSNNSQSNGKAKTTKEEKQAKVIL